MTKELYDLIQSRGKLPYGTRIKTTMGGIYTGADHELPEWQIDRANDGNGWAPFWIDGWADLHADLILPVKYENRVGNHDFDQCEKMVNVSNSLANAKCAATSSERNDHE